MSNTSLGRAQDRAKVAGGQDHEVKYEAGKTGASLREVKTAVKAAGNSRKRVEAELGRHGLPTGRETGANDVFDPHPSNEEQYDKQRNPGGARPPSAHDIGPNNAIHDGKPKRRPPPRKGASG
jgi:hypothetical protein